MVVHPPTLLSRLSVILFGMVFLSAALPVQAASWSAPIDGDASRTKVGEPAPRREIETLNAGGAAYRLWAGGVSAPNRCGLRSRGHSLDECEVEPTGLPGARTLFCSKPKAYR